MHPPAVAKFKWLCNIFASWCNEVITLVSRVGAAQSTQFILVVLVHVQEESVLPIYHYLEAKRRLQGNIITLQVDLY